jgi:hypothetical protein
MGLPATSTADRPVDECVNDQYAMAKCLPEDEADNSVVARCEDGHIIRDHGFTPGAP